MTVLSWQLLILLPPPPPYHPGLTLTLLPHHEAYKLYLHFSDVRLLCRHFCLSGSLRRFEGDERRSTAVGPEPEDGDVE